jgi:hypothetical protein
MYVFEHVTTLQQLFADCHLMQIHHLACTEFNTQKRETAVEQWLKVLRYKSEGRCFDPSWCHGIFHRHKSF